VTGNPSPFDFTEARAAARAASEAQAATIEPPLMSTARIQRAPVRDLDFERSWTRQAGEAVKAESAELIRFAEARAGGRPVKDLAGRDFTRELLEELADARNYCVWRAQQELAKPQPDGEVVAAVGRALEATVLAFAAAWRLRSVERGC
jgi:hypothetical protein